MAVPQNQGFRFCHLQHVIFTSWYLMAAGALAILSASQTAGKAKGFVLPLVLYCTSLTSH